MNYLENDSPTDNSIISCIIQEPCSDRLISEESFETSSVYLVTNKGPSILFFFNQYKKAGLTTWIFVWLMDWLYTVKI